MGKIVIIIGFFLGIFLYLFFMMIYGIKNICMFMISRILVYVGFCRYIKLYFY